MSLTQINKAGLDEIALDHVFTIGASGSSAYTFQGEGLNGTVNNPTLYLTRGKTYRFENGSGGHPIRIQSTAGASGTAYNTGVTNNAGSGTVIVEVQHDAPDVLYYQCTSHAAMNGILYITGALADGGVTTAKIAADAVTGAKIADDAINSEHYTDGSIDTAHIADSQVTNAKLADNAVSTARIADGAVNANKLGSAVVTTAKIEDNAVTSAKIANEAVTLAKLPHGTSSNDGKFLRANNGADPTFETVNTDLVADTTPQLGGNLDTNGRNINVTDDQAINFGASSDLYIKHSSGHNANFIVAASGDIEHHMASSKKIIKGFNNSGTPYVALYQDGNTRFYTRSNGGTVQGTTANVGIDFSTDGAHRGTVYANSSNQIGFLDTGGDWAIRHTNDSQTEFYVQTNRKAAIDADGLKFGSDTAAANALYDYEEGNFDPIMYEGQGSQQINYTWRYGNYVKIGSVVHIMLSFGIASFNTSGWNRSTITVPFNTAQNHAPFDNDNFSYIDLHGYSYLSGYGDGGGQEGGDNGGLYLQIGQSHSNRMEIVYGRDKNYAGVNQLAAGQRVAIQFSYYAS